MNVWINQSSFNHRDPGGLTHLTSALRTVRAAPESAEILRRPGRAWCQGKREPLTTSQLTLLLPTPRSPHPPLQASFEEKGLRKFASSRIKRETETAAEEVKCLNYEVREGARYAGTW